MPSKQVRSQSMSTHAKFDPVFRGAFLFVFLFSLLALEANASPLPRPGLTTHLEVRNPSPMEGAGADVWQFGYRIPVAGGIAMGPAKDSGLFGKIKDKIKQWFTREEN